MLLHINAKALPTPVYPHHPYPTTIYRYLFPPLPSLPFLCLLSPSVHYQIPPRRRRKLGGSVGTEGKENEGEREEVERDRMQVLQAISFFSTVYTSALKSRRATLKIARPIAPLSVKTSFQVLHARIVSIFSAQIRLTMSRRPLSVSGVVLKTLAATAANSSQLHAAEATSSNLSFANAFRSSMSYLSAME